MEMEWQLAHVVQNEKKWDSRAISYNERRFDFFRWIQAKVLDMVPLRPGDHFLDIGCGTGWAVREAARRMGDKGRYIGVDLSGNMVKSARDLSRGLTSVDYQKASADALFFEKESIDHIICTNSFHHYPSPLAVLESAARVMKPGSRMYVLDPTTDDPFMSFCDRVVRSREKEHVHFYSSREMRVLFEAAGLLYVDSLPMTYPLKIHLAQKPGRA